MEMSVCFVKICMVSAKPINKCEQNKLLSISNREKKYGPDNIKLSFPFGYIQCGTYRRLSRM